MKKSTFCEGIIIDENGFKKGSNQIQITGRLVIKLNDKKDFNWSDTNPDPNNNIYWLKANNSETPGAANRHPSFISLHFSGFEFLFSRNKTKKVLTTFGAI
ncbi:hypothetical protein GMMP15_1370089 [Candidatus Magnetomoraceae bacterium gMMP-15]